MKTLEMIHDSAREKNIPVMKEDGMDFLLEYIRKHERIRDILECGTAVGYSAIRMAGVRWDIRIDTLEIDPKMYETACQNIREQGLDDRIRCHLCDAAQFQTDRLYDLVFIDAAKSQYRRYLEHFLKNTVVGSVFLFDNLNFHGIVDHPELSENRSTLQMTRKILKFRDHLLADPRFHTVFYENKGDGIAIAEVLIQQ